MSQTLVGRVQNLSHFCSVARSPRPPGMKRKTYTRLYARLQQLEKPLIGSRILRYAPRWIAPLDY